MNDSYKKEEVSTKGTFDGQTMDEYEKDADFYDWKKYRMANNISWFNDKLYRLGHWLRKSWTDKVSDICLIILDIEISFILNVSWAFGMIGLMITQGFAFASVAKMMEASGDPEFFRSLQILSAFSFLGLFGIGLGIWWSINSFEGRLLDWLAGKSRK